MARHLLEPKLLLATHNKGKVREIADLVRPFGKSVVSAGDLSLPEPAETENTFEGNAKIKALAGAKSSGLPALSDDSGLCVAALGGAPGVYTADWAERQPFEANALGGSGRDWYLAMGKVEGKLAEQGPTVDRSAAFMCALCLAWPDGHTETFLGRVSGNLTWPPRGTLGFGYDPVFIPQGHTQTFAEIEPAEKHGMSHRADAFRQLVAACLES